MPVGFVRPHLIILCWLGVASMQRLMLANYYVQAKGDARNPCSTMIKRCAQATTDVAVHVQHGLSDMHKPQ